jgi:serine/threonine protein phosphatase PrpC
VYILYSDGHGVVGHEVSGFLKENLPIDLDNALKTKHKNILTDNIHDIITEVFLDTNYKLCTSDIIDSTFSGSTCVSLIYTPQKLICANVGDSRAVLGKYVNGEWVSHNLSRDHKPTEKDEADRILKKGGRIQPFKDEDTGEFIGPQRVWLKEDDIPGLAMTRSYGDRVAATAGTISDPEITEYKFTEDDKFFIVASDGVWEFIESQEVRIF